MSAGDPFNPYTLYAIRVPLGMLTHPGISAGAKLLYGRLALYLGRKPGGFCNPDLETLAVDMGASTHTIDRWLKELIDERFIERRRRGRFRAECVFLPNPLLFNSAELGNQDVVSTPQNCGVGEGVQFRSSGAPIPQICISNSADLAENRPQATETETVPRLKTFIKTFIENVHSSSSVVEAATLAETTDDDGPVSDGTEPGKPEDPDSLVSVARDQLRAARAAGAGVPLEQIGAPDREITVQILGAFSDKTRRLGCPGADFETWLESTVSRGVARKAKSATWGLYLSDAKNQAQDLRLKRESAEKTETDWALEQERRQAAEAEQRRAMETPMPIAEAGALVEHVIPWPLQARLVRTGEAVSPNELERQAKAWHRCTACRDTGTTGSAIDSDLRFCGCAAGVEAEYRDGADWPAREIERVHAGVKALLVEACRSLNRQFAGDGLQDADLADDGAILEIRPKTEADAICISDTDVQEALGRVGWQRVVRIVRPGPITRADIEAQASGEQVCK